MKSNGYGKVEEIARIHEYIEHKKRKIQMFDDLPLWGALVNVYSREIRELEEAIELERKIEHSEVENYKFPQKKNYFEEGK